jgi:hypothetical protein
MQGPGKQQHAQRTHGGPLNGTLAPSEGASPIPQSLIPSMRRERSTGAGDARGARHWGLGAPPPASAVAGSRRLRARAAAPTCSTS